MEWLVGCGAAAAGGASMRAHAVAVSASRADSAARFGPTASEPSQCAQGRTVAGQRDTTTRRGVKRSALDRNPP
jgi:hypothetical protein